MEEKYRDMLHMKRPVSTKHAPMSIKKRAGQFAPFAALEGHKEAIVETAKKYTEM